MTTPIHHGLPCDPLDVQTSNPTRARVVGVTFTRPPETPRDRSRLLVVACVLGMAAIVALAFVAGLVAGR
jgi:hypothetical protein